MKKQKNEAAETETTKKGKVANIIVTVLLIAVFAFGVVVAFTAFISKDGDGVPSFFGVRPFAIQTDSMSPTFNSGDLIIDVSVKDCSTLEVGDVITFWTVIEGERVLNSHRIIGINDYDTYLTFDTQGDNNTLADSLEVHQSEVVGKYCFHLPGVGAVIDFLQTSLGFGLCIVLPFGAFFIWQVVKFFKALFAYKAEKAKQQYEGDLEAKIAALQAEREALEAKKNAAEAGGQPA